MKDTSRATEARFRRMVLKRSGEVRLKMGCSMHASARALVIASLPNKDAVAVNRMLFLRFYGHEFEPKKRERIIRALRKASENTRRLNR